MEEAPNMTSYELGFGERKSFDQQDGLLQKGNPKSNMGSLPNCASDITAKSKNMFQRSLSRKVSQQEERNDGVANGSPQNSNAAVSAGACASDMSVVIEIPLAGTVDRAVTPPTQQLVANYVDSSYRWRKPGKQRLSCTDPWQILLFFATLSSVGTILLLYLTLSMGMLKGE